MHRQKVSTFLFLFLSCVSLISYAQISASPSQGCAPLNVAFTGPAGATSYTWDFGPGQGTSQLSSPSNIYVNAGTYNVTYTAIVSGNPVNYVTTVTVFPNPTGALNYILPASHCVPMTVTLIASGAPNGSNFTFFFGDLTSGTGSPITHTYGQPGNYVPQLTITDANNCANPLPISNGTIHVSSPPTIVTSANPGLASCSFPFTTSFSSSGSSSGSPMSPNLGYNWNFGNGSSTSPLPNPSNITFGQGEYTVTLTVTDDNQCSNTATMLVSVVQPVVTATIPPVVCVGDSMIVTVNSTPTLTMWQMGNGDQTTFNDLNPSGPYTHKLYAYGIGQGGTKTITIQTAPLGTCVATLTKTVMVEEIVPQFTFAPTSPTMSCSSPMLAPMINQSTVNTGATLSYVWGSPPPQQVYSNLTPLSSTATNPTFTLTQGSSNPYVVYDVFNPSVYIQVSSTNGCTANINHNYHFLQRPTAWFNKNKKEGCAPLTVTYKDSSQFLTNPFNPPLYHINTYTWNNGANPAVTQSGTTSPPSYTVPPFTYTYLTTGTYTPFLTIQTFGGCTDVSFIDTVVVSNPPNISINIAPSSSVACAGVTSVSISMQAVPGQTVQHWHAASDNNFYSGCVSNSTPSFPFTHTGIHNFTVIGSQFGCTSAPLVSAQSVTVYGPYAQFRFQTNCANTSSVNFYSQLQDVQTATLNFGDGTFQTFAGSIGGIISYSAAHIYTPTPSAHDYTVTLYSANPTRPCSQGTYTQEVHIRHAQAVITNSLGQALPTLPNALVCARDSLKLKANTSVDVATWCYKSDYAWFFYSSIPTETLRISAGYDTVVTRIPSAGIYTVMLRVRDINGCQSTDTKQFRVSGANPSFTFNANPICLSNNPVQMINNTSQVPPDVNANFWWNFGDGSPVVITQTASHSYNSVTPPFTNFSVKLKAQNSFGCKDSVVHTITVNNPSAFFFPSKYGVCVPDNVVFTGLPGYNTYSISYSDSTAGALVKPNNVFKHNYSAPGNHTVSLTVTDAVGCSNTSNINNISARVKPTASFSIVGQPNFCSPASITFTSTSTTTDPIYSSVINYLWDLGTGLIPTGTPSAVNVFTNTGVTTVSLIASPDVYCPDTAITTIQVYNTKGTLSLNKTKFCLGEKIIAAIINTQDVSNWQCNVGFGIQPSPIPLAPTQSVSYTYTNTTQTGTVNVVATISSPSNSCVKSDQQTIEIISLNPNFTRNLEQVLLDTIHCLRIPDQFTHGLNTANTTITYSWSFGDGGTSSDPNPVYTFPAAGVWPVKLTVKAPDVGCLVSSIKNMTINSLPTVTITADVNCPDKPFVISVETSQGVISGTWSPSENILDSGAIFTVTSSAFTTSAMADITTNFSLVVTDANACVSGDIAEKQIEIIQPPPNIHWDTTIVVGQTATLNSNLGSNYTYSWAPVFTDLSCQTCPMPVSSSTANITYSVQVEDYLHCNATINTYTIIVEPLSSVDVPTAFTPNGDGTNDVIYVAGWGIKKLNYYRIYNRWGQMLFETDNIKQGWDGLFNGVPQNVETYVYQVSVESYIDAKPLLKTGTFKLLR